MIKPLHNLVLIKPTEKQEEKGGLVTIDSEAPTEGTVIAVGPGRFADVAGVGIGTLNYLMKQPMSVSIGNKVYFRRNAQEEIKVDNKKNYLIAENDILAIIE